MEKKLKFDYDENNDVLYMYSDEKYDSSLTFFGFTIDITNKKSIKGIEIPDATKTFSELSDTIISKDMLKQISEPKMLIKNSK